VTGTPLAGSAALDALYQEQILEHYRRPHGKGTLPAADATATVRNPLCGEEATVTVALDRTGPEVRVSDIRFTGDGCSISQASASMMTDMVRGLTAPEIASLTERFTQLLHGDATAKHGANLGPLHAFATMSRVPARIPCALLAWKALAQAIG
jgi:nitrogen fixation protein NifU and related proteins